MKDLIKKTSKAKEKMMWDIIGKQQKLNKVYTLINKKRLAEDRQKYLRTQIKLIDENLKLSNEKKARIVKDFYNTMPPNISSYVKGLKIKKISQEKVCASIISKFKKQHPKTDDLVLLVEIIYGKYS